MRARQIAFLICFCAAVCHAEPGPAQLRYKFQAGDQFVYRETFIRKTMSKDTQIRVRATFENQLVVVDATARGAVIGVQRNRLSAELLEFRRSGKDVLAKELPKFAEQMSSRPARFADANLYAPEGFPLLPVQAVRESNSKLLYMVSEIAPLPTPAVQVGSEWDDPQYGMRFRLASYDGSSCAVIQSVSTVSSSHLSFTFCPESGVLKKLELDGEYPGFADVRYHEKVVFELVDTRHDRKPSTWMGDVESQQGALTAYLLPGSIAPEIAALNNVLREGPPEAQALALAILLRQNQAPAPEIVASLKNSDNSEVRRIANRFASPMQGSGVSFCTNFQVAKFAIVKPGTTLGQMKSSPNAPYLVHVPIDYQGTEPFPLIIYLSGGGGFAFDAALTAEAVLGHSGYLALYPQANGLWWEQEPTETFSTLLPDFLRNFNVDTNRIYLVGFSNGGTATVYYGILWPQRFAALSSLMGAGFQLPPSSEPLPMVNIRNIPLLLVHGDRDPLIPSEESQKVLDAVKLTDPRIQPELHILKGHQHDIGLANDQGLTLPFFERFRREPFPRRIEAHILNTEFAGRHYWIEVLEKKGSYAEVQGRIKDNNTVEVKTSGVKRMKLLLRPELFPTSAPIRVVVNGKERYSGELKRDCALLARSAEQYADPVLAYTDEVEIDLTK